MKKLLSVLLTLLLACGAVLPALAAANGDVDADGSFSASDARAILRAAVNLDQLPDDKAMLADLDMDGKLTAADARTALRLAVKLDISAGVYCENEYEVLLSGLFLTDVQIKMSGAAYRFRMAAGRESTYLEMSIEDLVYLMLMGEGAADPAAVKAKLEPALSEVDQKQTFGMLFTGKDFCLIDPGKKCYSSLGEQMGADEEEIGSFTAGMFDGLPKLSEADAVTDGAYNGTACKLYSFKQADGVMDIYMAGKKLVAVVNYDTAGAEMMRFEFNGVSLAVPAEYTAITAVYSKDAVSQTIDDVFMTMFALAMLIA